MYTTRTGSRQHSTGPSSAAKRARERKRTCMALVCCSLCAALAATKRIRTGGSGDTRVANGAMHCCSASPPCPSSMMSKMQARSGEACQ